jgi:enoyl-CoA hydratase/carnithine racemase
MPLTQYYEAMLKVEREGAVLKVSLNRPEVRNALNEELIAAITNVFETVSPEIRVVVISGEGATFCAGGDLEWMRKAATYTEAENEADALKISKMFSSIRDCKAVTIASIHGAAMGGGSGMVSACDIAIATEDSKFAFSEVKLGLIPATISPFVIDRIGKGHAKALFVTGEVFSAAHALTIGLIHEIAEGDRERSVNRKIRAILQAGPQSIIGAKALVNDSPLTAAETAKRLAAARASDEAKGGIAAFLNKEKAPFVTEMD